LFGDATILTVDAVRSRIATCPTKDGRSVLRTRLSWGLSGATAARGHDQTRGQAVVLVPRYQAHV
jgi:hypothetical protein